MAIEAKDLRLGNLTQNGTVTGIKDGVIYVHDGYSTWRSDRFIDGIEGIRLTPEWLERIGFTTGINPIIMLGTPDRFLYFAIVRGELYPALKVYPEFSNEEPQTISLNRIEFVHQLQNLYHTLTGCELEISPGAT